MANKTIKKYQDEITETPTENKPDRTIKLANELESNYKSSYYSPSYDFPYNPDSLVRANNYSIYDEMRDDEQIKDTLAIKKNMLIGNGWRIMCGDEVPESMADRIINETTDMLENIAITQNLGNTFESVLYEIMSCYDYGFSLSEIIYRYDKGLYKINKFVTRPPHTFEFNIDDKGNVISIIQNTNGGRKDFKPEIFFHMAYQPDFGNPYGKSDLRAAFKPWKAKEHVTKFMNMYLERYASPFSVLKYPSNLNPEEIDRLNDISRKIKSYSSLVLPEEILIELIQAQGSTTDGYVKALEYYNLKISRSILVPDLMGFGGGQTSGGSYSLGKQQFSLFLASIFNDKQALATKFTARTLMPLIRANYGEYSTWFEFIPPSDENIIEYAKTWAGAVGSRLWKPSEEEINHFRAITGFPEGDVEEVAPPTIDTANNPLAKKGDKANKADEGKDNKTDMLKKKTEMTEFKMSRQPNKYEKKMNFAEIEQTLDRAETSIERDIKSAAKDVIGSVIDQISMNPKAISNLEPKFLKQMNSVVKNNFVDMVKKTVLIAKAEILSKNFNEEDDEIEFYKDIIEQESFKIVGDYSAVLKKKATNMIAQGLKNNLVYSEIVRIVRDELKEESEKWINTVVRTKTNEIFNETRKRYFETNEVAREIVVAYEISAILDTRTSEICAELDGKIFDISDYTDIVKPPFHMGCRTILVPITKFEDYKDDPNYLTGDDRYTIEEIQNMGGNLIRGEEFAESDKIKRLSSVIGMQGEWELIPAVPGKRIKVLSATIVNTSGDKNAEISLYSKSASGDILIQYPAIIKPNMNYIKDFLVKREWILNKGESLYLKNSISVIIEYTIDYEVV